MIAYLFLAIFLAIGNAVQTEEGVIVLTDSDFDRYIKKHELILVLFFMPSCSYCQQIWPQFVKAA
jgi:thioredoxin-related protein